MSRPRSCSSASSRRDPERPPVACQPWGGRPPFNPPPRSKLRERCQPWGGRPPFNPPPRSKLREPCPPSGHPRPSSPPPSDHSRATQAPPPPPRRPPCALLVTPSVYTGLRSPCP